MDLEEGHKISCQPSLSSLSFEISCSLYIHSCHCFSQGQEEEEWIIVTSETMISGHVLKMVERELLRSVNDWHACSCTHRGFAFCISIRKHGHSPFFNFSLFSLSFSCLCLPLSLLSLSPSSLSLPFSLSPSCPFLLCSFLHPTACITPLLNLQGYTHPILPLKTEGLNVQ